jgi:fructose-specific phosphotransferase system IIC component
MNENVIEILLLVIAYLFMGDLIAAFLIGKIKEWMAKHDTYNAWRPILFIVFFWPLVIWVLFIRWNIKLLRKEVKEEEEVWKEFNKKHS